MNRYEIRDEEDKDIGLDILSLYYGNLWESAMDRLDHQWNGQLHTIQHDGQALRVFRKIENKQMYRP